MLGSVYMDTKRLGCLAVLVVLGALVITSSQTSGFNYCSALTTWTDNFDDGEFGDWTVELGSFTIIDGVLTGQEDTNALRHDSVCFVGNWSFDALGSVYVSFLAGTTKDGVSTSCYCLHKTSTRIELLLSTGWVNTQLGTWKSPNTMSGWQHFDVTRNDEGRFDIYLNGTKVFDVTNTRFMTSSYFVFYCFANGALDNVTINDVKGGMGVPVSPAILGVGLAAICLGLLVPISLVLYIRHRKPEKTQ